MSTEAVARLGGGAKHQEVDLQLNRRVTRPDGQTRAGPGQGAAVSGRGSHF